MLSNNGLHVCLCTAVQYVLLFLVLAVNSDWFQTYGVTLSYSSRLFLCALAIQIDSNDIPQVVQVQHVPLVFPQAVWLIVQEHIIGLREINQSGLQEARFLAISAAVGIDV